jgi:hypothetical protein
MNSSPIKSLGWHDKNLQAVLIGVVSFLTLLMSSSLYPTPPADIENSGLRYGVFFIFLAKKELNLRIKRWMSADLDQMLLNSRMQKILLKIG